tara:strand:- start:114 stop:314 length:201 start_codon:yes stop_codon:yes gene_type:complete
VEVVVAQNPLVEVAMEALVVAVVILLPIGLKEMVILHQLLQLKVMTDQLEMMEGIFAVVVAVEHQR